MSEALYVQLGDPLPLSLTLPDAANGLFPQAVVYDSNDVQVAGSPFDLTEVGATGRYTDAAFTPSAVDTFTALFVTYSDAGHLTELLRYERSQDRFAVVPVSGTLEIQQDLSFQEGAVWLDTINGSAGTAFPIGTPGSPVSNMADAVTIGAARGLTILMASGGLTLAGALTQFEYVKGYGPLGFGITGGGFEIGGVTFENCLIGGAILAGTAATFRNCDVSGITATGFAVTMILDSCSVAGTGIVISGASIVSLLLCNCFANVGVTAAIDMGGSAAIAGSVTGVGLIGDWSFTGLAVAGNVLESSFLGGGSVTLAAGNTAGSSKIDGDARVTDSSGAGHTVTDNTLDGRHGGTSWLTATGFAVAGDAMTLTPAERNAVANALLDLAGSIEDGTNGTVRAVLRLMSSVIVGLVAGGAGLPKFRAIGGTKVRVDGTADTDGNRTVAALDSSDGSS